MKKVLRFLGNEANFRFALVSVMLLASLCLIRGFLYYIAGVCLIWGSGLILYKFVVKKQLCRIRNRWLILLFMLSALVSCLLHIRDHFFINCYYLLWMAVCFLLFYGMHGTRGKNRVRRENAALLEFINGTTTAIMVIGLLLLFFFPKGFQWGGENFVIHDNRFVGILFNANVTAFYATAALVSSNILIAMRKAEHRLNRGRLLYYCFTALINLLSLFLSDSNDSLLLMIVYCCFIFFYIIFKGYHPGILNFLFRVAALVLACIVVSASLLGARTLVQSSVSSLLSSDQTQTQLSTGVSTEDGKVVLRPDTEEPAAATFTHRNTNLDSGRFVIWKQAIGLFERFPVFGIGKANIIDYGKTYLGGLRYDDFHNGLMTIAISYGLVGMNLFIVFAVTIAKALLKSLFRYRRETKQDGRVLAILLAFCAGYCVYSMFEISLLADLSYKVLFFWLILGIAASYGYSYERCAVARHDNLSPRNRSIARYANAISS